MDQNFPTLISVDYWALPGTCLFRQGADKQHREKNYKIYNEKSRNLTI